MDATVMYAVNDMVYKEVPTPSPEAGELLVRVRATHVCATDVNMYRGRHPGKFLPRILGHECAGEISEVGEGVTEFKPGDRVAINPVISCGKCELCHSSMNNLCEHGGLMGREENGSFARYCVIPTDRAAKVSSDISFEEASFAEALGSVHRGQRMSRLLRPAASVVVLGMGSIGMLHVQLAKLAGASLVIAVSSSHWKLDLALKLGANITISAKDDDPVKAVISLTHGRGADVVIEAAGVPETIRETHEMVRFGGEIIQYGIGPSSVDGMNMYLQYFKEFTTYGVRAVSHNDFSLAVKLLEDHAVKIEPLITHRFPLERTVEALELSEKPEKGVLGIIVTS
jgi:L-iditol 2-dehydrogenase